jgi:hypothetical protein
MAGGIAAGWTACELEESFIYGAMKYGETMRNKIQGKTIELKKTLSYVRHAESSTKGARWGHKGFSSTDQL